MASAGATASALIQSLVLGVALVVSAKPLGTYIASVFAGERVALSPILRPLERATYRFCRVRAQHEMAWTTYLFAFLAMSVASVAALYALLRFQDRLPFNPQGAPALSPDAAWNAAVSFATTCNWEAFTPETALSDLSQMAGMAWQNFVAAGAGLALAIAFVRGIARSGTSLLGNFWVDLTRAILYVLLPLSVAFALLFVVLGVPQTLRGYAAVRTLEGAPQTVVRGPMASQESISVLGGNGGGFVAANVASPNENPSPLSNALQLYEMLLLPAALAFAFGRMVSDQRQGRALFVAMGAILVAGVATAWLAESAADPALHALGVRGASLEGKEVRFGAAGAGLSIAVGTATTTGMVNGTLDSATPIGGLVGLVNMQIGEVAFGGVGSGLYGMLVFVVLTVFIAGLMVGRAPEYLGKKIEGREVQFAMFATLLFPAAVLCAAACALAVPSARAGISNPGPHGFTQILYAFTSLAASNGSAFAGLAANTPFYNVLGGLVMLAGRYGVAVPTLALAGTLARRARNPQFSRAAISTSSPTFVAMLLAVILIVGALTFLPADLLGPIAEQLGASDGRTF